MEEYIISANLGDGTRREVGTIVPAGAATYRTARTGTGVELTGERTPVLCRVVRIIPAGAGCSMMVAAARSIAMPKAIRDAARAHIGGCVGDAEPKDAWEAWDAIDLPAVKGLEQDAIRDLLAEAIRQELEVRQAAAALGRKGGSSTSDAKVAASRANGAKGGEKQTYYLLSGEGEQGDWSGPYTTTRRGIRARATRATCHGDRFARVFVLVPACERFVAHLEGIDNGEWREVPQ